MARPQYIGEYGGRVLREFKADGMPFIVGAEITKEQAEKWPLLNRIALFNIGKVEWYGPPVQRGSIVSKKVGEDVLPPKKIKSKEDKIPAVNKSSRTTRRRV